MSTYQAETHGVVVRVTPTYLGQQSDPTAGRWVWAYEVEIRNQRDTAVQLLTRHWVITDALGRTEAVRGPGVIGEQPVIEPGQMHRYTSGCPLGTASGSMAGSYGMTDAGGAILEVEIPAFSLDSQPRGALN
jgi:ApaG protein